MSVKVIPLQKTPCNIQVSKFSEQSAFIDCITRYALIPLEGSAFYVCKVFTSNEVHAAFVELDKSVIHVKETLVNGYPRVPMNISVSEVNVSEIRILPPATDIKSVRLSVVFESVSDIFVWEKAVDVISSVAKELLKMFAITSSSIVYLDNLPTKSRHGIHAFIIHTVEYDTDSEIGHISSKSAITVCNLVSRKCLEQTLELSQMPKKTFTGESYQLLKRIINLANDFKMPSDHERLLPPQKVILTGPLGCGKSSMVVSAAMETGATLISYSNQSTSNSNNPQNIRSSFVEAAAIARERKNGVCILLLDDLDIICKRRDGRNISADNISTTLQVLSLLEEAKNITNLVVIATTSKLQNLDPALITSNVFNCEIVIEQSEENREDLLKSLLHTLIPEGYLDIAKEIAHLTPGYVAADIELICHKVACLNDEKRLEGPAQWLHQLKTAVAETKPVGSAGALGVLKKRLKSPRPLGGLFGVKKKLRASLEEPLNHPEAYHRLGIPLPKGLLLYGPPGCAKTSLVHSIASTIPVTFLAVSSADLYSPFVGEAEQNIVDLFRRARNTSPSILFIDELDALVGRREGREAGVHDRILSAFLMEMDGVSVPQSTRRETLIAENQQDHVSQTKVETMPRLRQSINNLVVVIGATNRPDILDPALLRPGRFDKLVHVPAPNASEREDILRQITSGMPLHDDVDLKCVASKTEFYSGADLSHLCTSAALNALTMDGMDVTEIRQCHFDATLKTIKPSLSVIDINWYEKYEEGL